MDEKLSYLNLNQILTFQQSLFSHFYRKPTKFGVQEEQPLFLIDNKFSLLPVKMMEYRVLKCKRLIKCFFIQMIIIITYVIHYKDYV